MTTPFSYSTYFVLDKKHFNECYSNSVIVDKSWQAYRKAMALSLIGVILLFTEASGYIAYFMVMLGAVEALSVRYQQPWWVARQMLSRAANGKVTLTIDDKGIHSESFYHKTSILWPDITDIQQTVDGFVVYQGKAKSYISSSCLSEQAKAFLLRNQRA